VSFGDERLFCRFGMDKHNVSVAAPSYVECLTGAHREHFNGDAGLLRKERQQMLEQARIFGRSSGSYDNRFFLGYRVPRHEKGDPKDRD
jgi:hypothetical protein